MAQTVWDGISISPDSERNQTNRLDRAERNPKISGGYDMSITARERAERVIGAGGYQKLIDSGLVIGYQRLVSNWYPEGEKKVIGTVKVLGEIDAYPYVDFDENGFEIIYAASHERIFTEWISGNNCEVI